MRCDHPRILKRRFSFGQLPLVAVDEADPETLAMLENKGAAATPEQKRLAANFARALEESGVAPKEIAEKCGGITEQAVSNWKRSGKIKAKHLPVIADLTGWTVERLLAATDDGPSAAVISTHPKRTNNWPYRRIDYAKIVGLSGVDAINFENALLAIAGDINIDIRVEAEPNRKAA